MEWWWIPQVLLIVLAAAVVPLCLGVPASDGARHHRAGRASPLLRLARPAVRPAAALLAAAQFLPPGPLAAALAAPWLLTTTEAGATPMRVNPADLRNFPGRSGVPTEIAHPAVPGRSAVSLVLPDRLLLLSSSLAVIILNFFISGAGVFLFP